MAHIRRDALHKGTYSLTHARLTPEERSQRRAQIAASLPKPKTKVKAKKDKRSGPSDAPPLLEKIAKQVKEKQAFHLLQLAHVSDALLRPAVVVLEDLNVDGMKTKQEQDTGYGLSIFGEIPENGLLMMRSVEKYDIIENRCPG